MTGHSDLKARTEAWIDSDPDPATRSELESLLAAGAWEELGERMNGVLEFGTAGLRGAVEAGSNRMNRAVVIRTTAGLAAFLAAERTGPVVVGFDGRTSSQGFGDDTIGVLVAAGHEVHFFDEPVPTPLVAFHASELGAAAAVVITASHNPPADNGYKVYDDNGAQIVPPVDRRISDAIDAAPPAGDVPREEGALAGDVPGASRISFEAVYARYREAIEAVRPAVTRPSTYRVAYTPLHGVGWRVVRALFEDAGYDGVAVVESQRDPDGDFPTVAFPNPEEPGAMDAVISLGDDIDAHLVVANDPDADRLAVAVPYDGGWRALTGNEIGVLLGDWVLARWSGGATPIVINSIVSSPMLATVADLHGARFAHTLTGFKWIANAALDLEAAGEGRFAFGYEEALGYSIGPVVRDKDGMSAALVFVDMARTLSEQGSSVLEALDDLYRRAGMWVSTQESLVRPGSEGLASIEAAMERLGDDVPGELAGLAVAEAIDYRQGAEERPRWLPAASLVSLGLDGGGRVLIRPSGTEPKLKIYVDLPGTAGDDAAALRRRAEDVAEAAAEFLQM